MEKSRSDDNKTSSIAPILMSLLTGTIIMGGSLGQSVIRGNKRKEAVNNAVNHVAEDFPSGKIAPSVDPDKLAEILATDPEAMARFQELRSTLDEIDRMAEERKAYNAKRPKNWQERTEKQAESPIQRVR